MDIPLAERRRRHRSDSSADAPPLSREDSYGPAFSIVDRPGLAGTFPSSASTEPLVDPTSPQPQPDSKMMTALKTLKLKILISLYLRLRGNDPQEKPKIALHKHRGYAVLGSLIHVLPVGASLALASMNICEVYIGGELIGKSGQDRQKLGALQFAAKLHELVMISSLTAIILTYIRRNILYGDGLPLGALFAGQQFRAVSFFWSPEFLAAVPQKVCRNRRQYYFIALLVVCTLLGVSVGPSTAQLMQPQLADWPAGGTTFWLNATKAMIFPTRLESSEKLDHCLVDTGDLSCPHGGWRIIDSNYISYFAGLTTGQTLPESILIDGARSQRYTMQRTRGEPGRPLYFDDYTRASVPMSSVAATNVQRFKRFWSHKDAKYSINAPQPAMATICHVQRVKNQEIQEQGLWFPNLTSVESNAITQGYAVFNLTQLPDEGLFAAVLDRLNSTSEPDILWVEALDGLGTTVNAVAIFPPGTSTPDTGRIYLCSLDSRYIPATTTSTRNLLKRSSSENIDYYWSVGIIDSSFSRIALSAGWTQYLNPAINSENWTAFAKMSRTAQLWNASSAPPDSLVEEITVEAILTTMTLNGIARADYNTSIAGSPKGGDIQGHDFLDELLPHKYLGTGGRAYEITDGDLENATAFNINVFANGYAYTYRSTTQKAAIAVLLLYSLLAVFHLGYTLWTGEQSNAWDTTPELFALAMNSARTEALKNTGAGIETSDVFKQIVKVQAKEGDHLEFVFRDTEEENITDAFRRDKYYG